MFFRFAAFPDEDKFLSIQVQRGAEGGGGVVYSIRESEQNLEEGYLHTQYTL